MSKSKPRKGGRLLTEIDLIEVSAVAKPMHPSTRALSWKTAADADRAHEVNKRRREAQERQEREERGEQLVKELAARAKAEEAKAAKKARPIKVKTFEV